MQQQIGNLGEDGSFYAIASEGLEQQERLERRIMGWEATHPPAVERSDAVCGGVDGSQRGDVELQRTIRQARTTTARASRRELEGRGVRGGGTRGWRRWRVGRGMAGAGNDGRGRVPGWGVAVAMRVKRHGGQQWSGILRPTPPAAQARPPSPAQHPPTALYRRAQAASINHVSHRPATPARERALGMLAASVTCVGRPFSSATKTLLAPRRR